ncbi:MAG: TIGR02099 family protein [Gammaproteobacteria bacterium]|nr:TIGR02099 family protein [Gammaproteobacteria bacterium]
MRSKQESNLLAGLWSWFSITCIHCARVAWYFGVILFVVAAAAITIFRFWLPALVDRKAEVETYLTKQVGQSVVIGEMAADWQGLYPSLHARKLALKDASGKKDVQLSLDELRLDLDIVPLLQGKLVFRQITLKNPVIHVSRSPEGEFYIGKFKAPTPKKGRLATLFRQYKVTISGGRFIWHDHFLKEKEFKVTDINFSMENKGKRHIFKGSVKLPESTTKEVSIKFDIHGNIPEIDSWDGRLSAKISDLEFSGLPGIVNERLALPVISGRVSMDLSTDWTDGVLKSSAGHIKGNNLLIPLGAYGSPISVRSVEADINFENSGESWLLTFENTLFAIAGKPWPAGRIQASYRKGESSLHVSKLKLADLRPVLDALTSKNKTVQLVKSLYPSGNASDVSLTLYGPIKKPNDFLYKMSVSETSINAYQIYPAATGLKASITITKKGGSIAAEGEKSRIVLNKVYEHPLRVDHLQANVNWKKEKESWRVEGQRIWLKNKDAEAVARFIVTNPIDHSLPPLLKLNVDLTGGNLSKAEHYFPVLLMKPGIRRWFEGTQFRGRLNTVKLDYDGTVKGFPVIGARRFNVVANIGGGSMYFAPGWPRLTGVDADLVINNSDLWVNGYVRDLYGQKVDNSTVHLSNLAESGKQVVDISTLLHGDLGKVLDFLQSGPLFRNSTFQELNLAAKGHGKMKLDLSIPLANTAKTRVKGEYKITDASLQLPDDSWITELNGTLDFTERSLSSSSLQGKQLGGPLSFSVKTLKEAQPPVVEVDAKGEAYARYLGPLLGEWIAKELEGKAVWHGKMRFDEDKISLKVNADLKGLASLFPYPLAKKSEEKLPLQLDVSFLPNKKTNVTFSVPLFVNGNLFFSAEEQGMVLTGGCLLLGRNKASCTDRKGLTVAVEQAKLDLDPWDSYIKRQDGDDGIPAVVTQMSGKVDRVSYSKVDMADVDAIFDRQKDGSWQGKVDGERIKGDVGFKLGSSSKWVKMRLEKLIWNKAKEEQTGTESVLDPVDFPSLDVAIENLVFHKMKLGRLTLLGEPTDNEWELQLLKLDRPEMKVTANGRWRGRDDNHTSSFDVDFTSTDMMATLIALDFNLDFESKLFRTTGDISWKGAPYNYRMGILDGTLEVHSDRGRLSGVEVGAGRLLGVFNIDSLRRRLLLDFSDLSKEGFAFDSIDADVSINQGIANIPKLIMSGPSATIKLEGQLGLVKEDVDMKMSVLPALGGNLAIAGYVLGGPAGGVATYLASKAIKNQIEKSTNYQYTISGSWGNPVVKKIQAINASDDTENLEEDTAPGG